MAPSSPSASSIFASTPSRELGGYALFDAIASGGMASVHLGRRLDGAGGRRTVAIKRLHEAFAFDPEYVAMMLDEARLVRRIAHANVVPTLDVVHQDGELWLIMEYVAGESLSALLKRLRAEARPAPVPVLVDIVVGALRGLHAAHVATSESGQPLGIVHRDVSPQNIIVGVDGAARVLDFGIAKAAGRMQHTRTGSIKGKVRYMAPEQVRGQPTHLTDVYAASIVLWEALTGRRLFSGENDVEIMYRVVEGRVESPVRWRPGLSPALEAAVMCGLRKAPSERFPTAAAMADALRAASPPVPREAVARWLAETAGPELSRRESLVAAIESHPVASPPVASRPTLPDAPAPAVQVSTLSAFHPVSGVLDAPAVRSRRASFALAAVTLLLLLLVPFAAGRRGAASPAPVALPAAVAVPALDSSPPLAPSSEVRDEPALEPSTPPAPLRTSTPALAPPTRRTASTGDAPVASSREAHLRPHLPARLSPMHSRSLPSRARAWPIVSFLSLLLLLLLAASPATAQPPAPSPAESLFEEGLQDMRAGHYDAGCPRLAESYRLDPLPGALFTLADCEAAWGRTATALEHYQTFIQVLTTMAAARRDCFAERRSIALAKMAALAGIVPELTVDVGAGAAAGTVVKRNGVVVDRAAYGVGRKVDPGDYVVTAELDGRTVWERGVHLAERDRARVEVPATTGDAPIGEPHAVAGSVGATSPSSSRPTWITVAAIAGGAGLVTGIVAGSVALADKSTIDSECPGHACTATGRGAVSSAQSAALVSTIGFAVGLVGGATAGALWLTAPHPTVMGFDRGAGVGFAGAF